MKKLNPFFLAMLTFASLMLAGCGSSDSNFSKQEPELAQALARVEYAEAHFSSSATYDQLIVKCIMVGSYDRVFVL